MIWEFTPPAQVSMDWTVSSVESRPSRFLLINLGHKHVMIKYSLIDWFFLAVTESDRPIIVDIFNGNESNFPITQDPYVGHQRRSALLVQCQDCGP